MQIKEIIDLLSKKADIVYKKIVILLAASGGTGSYAISVNDVLYVKIGLFLLFGFFIIGVIVNYFELNKIKKQLDNFNKE